MSTKAGDLVPQTVVQAGLALIPDWGGALAVVAGAAFELRRRGVTEAAEIAMRLVDDGELFIKRVSEEERLTHLFLDAMDAASRTALREKRRLLGLTVGRAVLDDAQIDNAELVVAALKDLDAVHFRLLEELQRISDRHNEMKDTEYIPEATRQAAARYPTPVRSALIRHGAVDPATVVDGGTVIRRVTAFGRALLDDVREAQTSVSLGQTQ